MRRRGVPGGRVFPEALVTAANMRHAGQRCDNCGSPPIGGCPFDSPISPVQQMNPSVPCSDESRQLCALTAAAKDDVGRGGRRGQGSRHMVLGSLPPACVTAGKAATGDELSHVEDHER